MVSWRFLLPNQSREVRLHRQVFLHARPGLPRPAWALVVLYSSLLWFFFFGWQQIFRVFRKYARFTQEHFSIPWARQFVDLLNLVFLHGVPPRFYYLYGLFRQPQSSWFRYVYNHELPQWHQVLAGRQDSSQARLLLADKKRFAEHMAQSGLSVVPVAALLPKGKALPKGELFAEKNLFIKSRFGSGGKNCFTLLYDPATDRYQLSGKENLAGEGAIAEYLTAKTAQDDFMVQSLLINHPEIEKLCRPPGMVTIRLITAHDGLEPVAIAAVLEIPRVDSRNTWRLLGIDCANGQLLEPPDTLRLFAQAKGKEERGGQLDLTGKVVPCWSEALQLCLQAHVVLAEMVTVGWDVVITPAGAMLLEGNVNWGVAGIQRFCGGPLLDTALGRVYSENL